MACLVSLPQFRRSDRWERDSNLKRAIEKGLLYCLSNVGLIFYFILTAFIFITHVTNCTFGASARTTGRA